jgi:hypothetical protein
MKLKTIALLFCLFSIQSCVTSDQQNAGSGNSRNNEYYDTKQFSTEDRTYEAGIKSVQLYQFTGMPDQVLSLPIIPLGVGNLFLEFDELEKAYESYWVKILNCNYDWTVSDLPEIMYLYDYNQFQITDYDNSSGTKVNFTHYRFQVPKVKLSGNYLIKVYRNNDENDIILTRRFMVYQTAFDVPFRVDFSSSPQKRFTHQEVIFNIFYSNIDIINPAQQVQVVVRQNNRWDNAKYNFKPTFIKDYEKKLEYNFYNLENNFEGGNEFRFLNFKNFQFLAQGISNVEFKADYNNVYLGIDRSRKREAYTQWNDINGKFFIDRQDATFPAAEADYAMVHFYVESEEELPGRVFVKGAFSDWRNEKKNQLFYNATQKRYEGKIFLKQGIYSYMYSFQPDNGGTPDDEFFEGSYYVTENQYDILVYFRPVGSRSDLLMGYKTLNSFSQR